MASENPQSCSNLRADGSGDISTLASWRAPASPAVEAEAITRPRAIFARRMVTSVALIPRKRVQYTCGVELLRCAFRGGLRLPMRSWPAQSTGWLTTRRQAISVKPHPDLSQFAGALRVVQKTAPFADRMKAASYLS